MSDKTLTPPVAPAHLTGDEADALEALDHGKDLVYAFGALRKLFLNHEPALDDPAVLYLASLFDKRAKEALGWRPGEGGVLVPPLKAPKTPGTEE